MDFEESCGAEAGSLRVIELEIEEVTHECRHEDGHDGEHQCLGCGISWILEVPC